MSEFMGVEQFETGEQCPTCGGYTMAVGVKTGLTICPTCQGTGRVKVANPPGFEQIPTPCLKCKQLGGLAPMPCPHLKNAPKDVSQPSMVDHQLGKQPNSTTEDCPKCWGPCKGTGHIPRNPLQKEVSQTRVLSTEVDSSKLTTGSSSFESELKHELDGLFPADNYITGMQGAAHDYKETLAAILAAHVAELDKAVLEARRAEAMQIQVWAMSLSPEDFRTELDARVDRFNEQEAE